MRKLLCRKCGNANFFVVNTGGILCKCGLRLTNLSDYRMEKPPIPEEQLKCQANLITKISLLKWEIDRCLDERDQEGFEKLSFQLKICQDYLEKQMNHSQERAEYRPLRLKSSNRGS